MKSQTHVGVIVARFQGQRLHEGWRGIIDTVHSKHENILILLGVHGGLRTKRDPLTFSERAYMVKEAYPDDSVTVLPLHDHPISTERWSQRADRTIAANFPAYGAVLYGSRKSFIPFYSGQFKTVSITPKVKYSGTELRETAKMPTTEAGRAGIIHAVNSQPDIAYSTVDVAIIDKKLQRVLLIGKPSAFDEFVAFPGGFIDPTDKNSHAAALRERKEEVANVRTGKFTWVGHTRMADPRYRDSTDGTHTTLFVTDYKGGEPRADDDAENVGWYARKNLKNILVPWHRPLIKMLDAHW